MADNGRRKAAALSLAAGKTIRDTATELGIGERTIGRWLNDAGFRAMVEHLRGEMFARAVGRLADLQVKAVEALASLLDSPAPLVKLQAAKAIINDGVKLREHLDLAERLAVIEERLAAREQR
jgi:hypothetical protein